MEDENEFKSSDATKLMEMLVAGGVLTVVSVFAASAFYVLAAA
ncbi:MAG: hypothetical protein ACI8PZ_001349 [Myxococcota bacterium]|jgi:hypothetical protein